MVIERNIENEAYLHAFNYAPIGMALLSPDGEWMHGNAALTQFIGYSLDELKNLTIQEIIHPEDLADYLILRNELLLGNQVSYQLEKRFLHKSGNIVWGLSSVSLVRDKQGQPSFFVAEIIDISERKIAEEKLKEQESLFKLISEHSQDIISYVNSNGVNEYVSSAIKFLLGYEPEEVIGKLSTDYYHPDDLAKIMQSDLLKYSDQDSFITRVRHKNGHYVWFETTVKIIRNTSGELEKVFGIGRNITERRNAEEELRKTKERLESFVKNNADAIWMVDMDDIVLEVNSTFETMFGWKTEEVIGKPLPIIPDSLSEWIQQLHKRVKTGESVMGFETIRKRKDGGTFHVSATLSPVRDSQGTIIGISGVCRDISERKLAEEEAFATRQHLQSFIDNHTDAILIYSKDGKVASVNPAFEKLFGWAAADVLNQHFFNLQYIPENKKDEVYKELECVRLGQQMKMHETIRVNKNGDCIDILLTGFPIYDSHGEFNGWSEVLRDITEWKKSQEILQNSEKLTVAGQLAAGIAHEIRNPITSIKGFLKLIQMRFTQKKEYFDIINSEIDRIELILSELLVLAKPQSIKFERKDIRVLLTQVVTLLDPQAKMNNVTIHTEFTSNITHVHCDENQLKQVFINFIKNGMEAMQSGGDLFIQVRLKGPDKLLVRIIDHGCGIPEEVIARIGQPFYTTKSKGTGLGFMISKKIIENHEGTVEIESQINVGTTIEIILPIRN